MTITMRARFSKGPAVRYISHLDLQRLIGRLLRRARVPIAFSQGFNPHPILSFGSALSVGLTSDSEFMDIQLSEKMSPEDFVQQMNAIAPSGLSIVEAFVYETEDGSNKLKTLMSIINTAEYEIILYPNSEEEVQKQLEKAFEKIHQSETWIIKRFNKKKERELDIKPFIYQIGFSGLVITATVQSGSEANVRPDEIMKLLHQYGDLPEIPCQIHRKNLGIMEEKRIVKPFFA